jgi:hypothetical protein
MRRAFVLTVMVLIAAGATAGGAGSATTSPGINTTPALIAQRGFGDSSNSYAWAMGWFKGKLYVGTARNEICVENATVDYYLIVSGRYTTNPLPGTHCASNRYALELRAEIWQYTPRTATWKMVYRSPTEPNPRARGKRIARDIAYRGMVVYRGRLYIGDVTADEYIPELKQKYPPRLLSTADGVHFTSIPATGVIENTVHGTERPMGFRSMKVWRGRLFVTVTPTLTGDGVVFEVVNPTSAHPRFRQVSPGNLAVFEIELFNGSLYLGTGDRNLGYGVYRGTMVRGTSRLRLRPIVTGGAGRGAGITSVVSMHVFNGQLYVGASGWYNPHYQPNSELIRIDRRDHWQLVAGATRIADGRTIAPISGLGDGFYSAFAAHFWRMETYHGAMFVGTNDWSWLVQKAFPGLQPAFLPGIIQTVLSPDFGFDLWASCNGRDWFPVTRDAFGNMYDFGARNIVATPVGMFVGSADQAQGTKIWDIPTSPCQALNNAPRSPATSAAPASPTEPEDFTAAMPHGLLTDSQRHGTVVSWNATRGATKYEVLRSSDISVSIDLARPATLPDGFAPDGQVPNVVAPGTPGAAQLNLPVPQNFVPIGTTRDTYFIDSTTKRGQRYLYRIVAIGPSGQHSMPSAVQAAPDPRPAPTIVQLLEAIPPMVRSTLAGSVRTDVARHNSSAELRLLAGLQLRYGLNTDAGSLIERLARRIQYAGLAGGD